MRTKLPTGLYSVIAVTIAIATSVTLAIILEASGLPNGFGEVQQNHLAASLLAALPAAAILLIAYIRVRS